MSKDTRWDRSIETFSDEQLLFELVRRNGFQRAAKKTEYWGDGWVTSIVGVGKDHSVSITMDIDDFKELSVYLVMYNDVIDKCKEALAQTQEPVANYCKECLTYNGHHEGCSHYTTPPQRTWVGLTNKDITQVINLMPKKMKGFMVDWDLYEFSKAYEAKLKQKNGYAEEKNT